MAEDSEVSRSNAGQPTRYNYQLIDKTKKYIEGHWQVLGQVVPSMSGLAVYLKISSRSLNNYGKKYPEYFQLLSDLADLQQAVLIDGGVSGRFNSTITKLLLAKHGYSDKVEIQQDITNSDDSLKPASFKGVTKDDTRVIEGKSRVIDERTPDIIDTKQSLNAERMRAMDKQRRKIIKPDALNNWRKQ